MSDQPTPMKGTPTLASVKAEKKDTCPKKDCPLTERRRRTDKMRPYVDIAKIAVGIAMAHLVIKIVMAVGVAIQEIRTQTELVQAVYDHAFPNHPPTKKGGK